MWLLPWHSVVVNKLQPNIVNDNRRKREQLVRVPLNGDRHRVNISISKFEEKEEEEPINLNEQDYHMKLDIPFFFGTMGVEELLGWISISNAPLRDGGIS